MEATYKFFYRAPVNPKKPSEGFFFQLWFLKRMGFWAPETDNPSIQTMYTIWSIFNRGFFLYTYTFCQMLFFKDVENLMDAVEGIFFLMTQLTLLYKLEKFYSNRHRIKRIERILSSSLFCPRNEEEDEVIKKPMLLTSTYFLGFYIPALMTIAMWFILPLVEPELRLPVNAWFPWDWRKPMNYAIIYIYQLYGIITSASCNVSTDSFASGMIVQANAQVQRLGVQLKRIGYDGKEGKRDEKIDLKLLKARSSDVLKQLKHKAQQSKKVEDDDNDDDVDEQMREINKEVNKLKEKYGENYGEVIRCIIYHENILQFSREIQDIFKGPIFAQVMASTIIICMTCFLLANQQTNVGGFISSIMYLFVMVYQILIFCWVGNEVIYSSNELTQNAYFSNFASFDRNTANALRIFMQRTKKDIKILAGIVFEVSLSMPTFLAIIKSSYSYFAVLNSMQEK